MKKAFPLFHELGDKSLKGSSDRWNKQAMTKAAKPVAKGMTDMLEKLELKLEGKHHSGIDDAKNLAKCVITLLERDYEYKQSMIHTSDSKKN